MEIHFVSTLTSDDEDNIAPALLKAATSLLDRLSLAYTLRIETTAQTVYQYHHPAIEQRDHHPAVEQRAASETADANPTDRRPVRRVAVPQC